MAIALTCVSAAAIACRLRGYRLASGLLAALLVLAVLDDALQLHDRRDEGIELLAYAVLVALAPLLWYVAAAGPAAATRVARIGLVCLVLSVAIGVGFRHANRLLLIHRHPRADAAEVASKQGFELAGWVLAATGLSAAALTAGRRPLLRAKQPVSRATVPG